MAVCRSHRQFADNRNWSLAQVVSGDRSPQDLLPLVRAEVAGLDPELVVHRPAPMTDVVARGTSRERFALVLMATFAAIALALAAIGLYGVLAYAVRQRSTEIGIRIALGASARQVRALVFRQAAGVVGTGAAAGVAGALLLGRRVDTLAFGIEPSDPRMLAASAAVLAPVAFIDLVARAARLVSRREWRCRKR